MEEEEEEQNYGGVVRNADGIALISSERCICLSSLLHRVLQQRVALYAGCATVCELRERERAYRNVFRRGIEKNVPNLNVRVHERDNVAV